MNQAVMPAGLSLREATAEDAAAIIEVVNAAFEAENFFVNRPRTNPRQMAEHFASGRFLLAHRGPELIATVYVELRGERGYLGMLAVRPGEQRTGVGRAMMLAAESDLRGRGCRYAELSVVDVRTNLPPIYRKLGYRDVCLEEPHPDLAAKATMPVKLLKMEKPL